MTNNSVRRPPAIWTATAQRDVLIVALGVHDVGLLTRTPLLNRRTTLTRLWKRQWSTSKLTDVSMKIRLQNLPSAFKSP